MSNSYNAIPHTLMATITAIIATFLIVWIAQFAINILIEISSWSTEEAPIFFRDLVVPGITGWWVLDQNWYKYASRKYTFWLYVLILLAISLPFYIIGTNANLALAQPPWYTTIMILTPIFGAYIAVKDVLRAS